MYQVFSQHAVHLLHNQELTVVIYNAQQIVIINHKNIYNNYFTAWLGCCFSMQLHILVFQLDQTVLYCIFYIGIHVYPVSEFACRQPCLLSSSVVAVQSTLMVYALSSCRFASLAVASCIFHMDVHTARSTVVLIVLTLCIGLISVHLCCLHGCGMVTNLQ